MSRPRVLVTGASGFIGRYVLPLLVEDGCDVIAISRHAPASEEEGVSWLTGDLLDEDDCRRLIRQAGAEVLLHLAWYAEHGKFWASPENFAWVRASLILLDEFSARGGKRMVVAGTCAEYDWRYGYCVEDVTPTESGSVYGQCKDATRRLVQAYAGSRGLQWAWGRIFFPFGFGEPANRLLPSVIHALLNGETVRCSHGRQYRDFLPVEDVADAFAHLVCRTDATGVFNVSSGNAVRISQVVKHCIACLGMDAQPLYGAVEVAPDDPPMVVGDNARLRQTGWSPAIGWDAGIERLVSNYRSARK